MRRHACGEGCGFAIVDAEDAVVTNRSTWCSQTDVSFENDPQAAKENTSQFSTGSSYCHTSKSIVSCYYTEQHAINQDPQLQTIMDCYVQTVNHKAL